MFESLHAVLAPLRSIDWPGWDVRPIEGLRDAVLSTRRYCNVPPEAVPLLDLGVDGCHYAAWIDDVRQCPAPPGIIMVSPMDSYPDAIQWVAPSVESFIDLIRPDDVWLTRDDPSIDEQGEVAQHNRSSVVTAMTADGMGVVDPGARVLEAFPDTSELQEQLSALLADDKVTDALVLARNAIAAGTQPPGFGTSVAAIYNALHRPEYASAALRSYETPPAVWESIVSRYH